MPTRRTFTPGTFGLSVFGLSLGFALILAATGEKSQMMAILSLPPVMTVLLSGVRATDVTRGAVSLHFCEWNPVGTVPGDRQVTLFRAPTGGADNGAAFGGEHGVIGGAAVSRRRIRTLCRFSSRKC